MHRILALNMLTEMLHGGSASAKWLCGVPFVNFRIARKAQTKQEAGHLIHAHFSRFLADCGIQVEVSGTPSEQGMGCVVCYNESSFADVAAFDKVMWPHVDRGAAADLCAFFPFGRSSCRKAEIELVSRRNRHATERLMERMVLAEKTGERLAWGGEGRISGQDGVARFKIGAGLIAIRSQAPVIPVAFCGGHRLMPFRSIRARPGTIHVQFGAPISTTAIPEDNVRDLADYVHTVVAGMYKRLRPQNASQS